ncbi:hypothetical protein [Halococcus saccharolyticus]|uniref:Phage head morphogenesis domain-containing protein n=1 Tax=Halococcus saccharolyticus DSM 5350 TaxID=1227455 RepID=M0MQX9_9EURY|nr:hypothetical protein [Halococcus saccharolyticus]EMA48006.1 hypothetical protein C449_01000 [Halococcus saccharolyticus DSM 5350]
MSTSANGPAQGPRQDPTQTTTQRRTLRQDLSGRTRDVRGAIRRQIENAQSQATQAGAGAGPVAAGLVGAAGGLAALRSIGALRDWLTRLFDEYLLEPATGRQVQAGQHWTSSYTHHSYETGLRQARSALRTREYDIGDRGASAAITDQPHEQALQRQYEQAYYDLEDAVENTKQQVTRTIADGGYIEAESGEFNKRELIADINTEIEAQFGTRIRMVAAIEPVDAANEAALTAYQRAGVEQVGVEPEAPDEAGEQDLDWVTAGDWRVCLECRGLSVDGPYLLENVLSGDAPRPIRDSHLGCRCFLLPL